MSDDPKSFQTEAKRLADAARERAAGAFEEVKLNSNQLVDKVRELIEEGNVRRIAVKKGERTIFEIPLTVGAGAAAAAVLFNPLLAGLGAVAALVSEVTLVIQREDGEEVPLKDVARDVFEDAKGAVTSAAARATGGGSTDTAESGGSTESATPGNTSGGSNAASGSATGSGTSGGGSTSGGTAVSSDATGDDGSSKTVGRKPSDGGDAA